MTESVPRLFALVEIAKALSVSPHTVRSWVRQGKLKPTRICRRLLFSAEAILELISKAK